MSEKLPLESSSLDDLEQLPALEESIASFGIGDLNSDKQMILKDWSAQDFSNAYVRFRPHLERHAARFLRDPFQIEEVVQDAFLYLMTALPELDSEIGVLRFLKWKTKMLALDIIRVNSKYSIAPIEDHEQYTEVSAQEELGLELERADESAVVRLALAQLSSRQRQVIVETQLLEKPLETVAQEMGLSNNALRQLLHRARAAFKVALVGEAEVRGLPASAILTLAAKKAARESGKVIAGASVFLLAILGIASIGSISMVPVETENITMPTAEQPLVAPSQSPIGSNHSINGPVASQQELPEPAVALAAGASDGDESSLQFDVKEAVADSPEEAEFAGEIEELVDAAALSAAVDEFVVLMEFAGDDDFDLISSEDLLVRTGKGYSVSLGIDLEADNPVQFVYLSIELPIGEVIAVPRNGLTVVEESDMGTVLSYAATDFIVGDLSGRLGNAASASTLLSNSSLHLSVLITENGMEVLTLKLQPRDPS